MSRLLSPRSFTHSFTKHWSLILRKQCFASSPVSLTEAIKRTGLYDFHIQHKGQMVPFAGYSMPLQYADEGVVASTNWVRESAGLFDVVCYSSLYPN